ncbi:hypothetical protein Poli38472_012431 [Pythium oligandrum]|uniref:Ion transport domain-containing protein n=1 Tax=Pythium oligandrum TaxID=41045 RepID=A0A8K1CPV4_PYTOL|nr:hypothetical protein Poli38472_012431 [Pythium oligandrum]|eukprot:TMW67315.1 hypothetical protein Poli38472_012431 [Pythium oligandrum]
MILSMIQNDIARFVCVYFAVMAGFSQAIYLVKDGRVGVERLLHRVRLLLIAGFTGEVDYNDNYTDGRMNPFTQVLMFGYIMLVMILLVNLLIAMMGNTYTEVLTDSEHRWVAECANIMAAIENQCSAEQNYESRKKYAIPMITRGGMEELFLQIETSEVEVWRSQDAQDDEEKHKAVDEDIEKTVEEELVQKL